MGSCGSLAILVRLSMEEYGKKALFPDLDPVTNKQSATKPINEAASALEQVLYRYMICGCLGI